MRSTAALRGGRCCSSHFQRDTCAGRAAIYCGLAASNAGSPAHFMRNTCTVTLLMELSNRPVAWQQCRYGPGAPANVRLTQAGFAFLRNCWDVLGFFVQDSRRAFVQNGGKIMETSGEDSSASAESGNRRPRRTQRPSHAGRSRTRIQRSASAERAAEKTAGKDVTQSCQH